MASTYPGGLDSFDTIASDKKTSDAVGGRTHRAMHNDLGDAIEAIETELGTNPSGSDATVAARLTAIEAGALGTKSITNRTIAGGQAGLAGAALDAVTGSSVKPLDVIDGLVYGTTGTTLKSSDDGGRTWTTLATTPHEFQRILATSDGEMVAVANNYIYRSSGWSSNPATATWSLKITANASCVFQRFQFDGDGAKFIAGEYSSTRADSRYVHISTDSGATWSTVWDTVSEFPATHGNSHLHGVCYDPWDDRFWLIEGHQEPSGFYYSDDDGSTWTRLTGGYADSLSAAFPTVIVATDDGLVCGSDYTPNGIYGIPRTVDAENLEVKLVWRRWENRNGAYGFAERGFRDPVTGVVWMGFRSEYVECRGYIAAGTATSGGLVWESSADGTGDRVTNVVVAPDGTVIGDYITAAAAEYILTGQATYALAPAFPELGNIAGATIGATGEGTAVAAGQGAAASGVASTAVGASASAPNTNATAYGYGASAAGNGTAVGKSATASGSDKSTALGATSAASNSNATALGYGATAGGSASTAVGASASAPNTNATAYGYGASAAGNGTAVGKSATASGADHSTAVGQGAAATAARSTAVGDGATCGHDTSVALGYAKATTAAGQVQLGAAHIELSEVTAPSAGGANSARLFVQDNGAGKTQLCVRFASGAVQVLATEP